MNNLHSVAQVEGSGHSSIKGRGSRSHIAGRFAIQTVELDPDGEPLRNPDTVLRYETAKSLISQNQSPDVPFSLSINPYRGCEQGCIYCFARPSHAYLDLSPGLDFETRLTAKHNAAELFESALRKSTYRCQPIALGINTDAYQPVEKHERITRSLLKIALAFGQPISIVTKSSLILRDIDLLAEMAKRRLIHVAISLTTLDNDLKRIMEPRAASPARRLRTIEALRGRGIPVSVLLAPLIPLLNEREMEKIIAAAKAADAQSAAFVLLRLPHEVAPLFIDWLYRHFPQRAGHIIARLKDMHGGQLYNPRFGERMRGNGIFAELIEQRFALALKKHSMAGTDRTELDCSHFAPPPKAGDQLPLL